jgi:hypothetical protein
MVRNIPWSSYGKASDLARRGELGDAAKILIDGDASGELFDTLMNAAHAQRARARSCAQKTIRKTTQFELQRTRKDVDEGELMRQQMHTERPDDKTEPISSVPYVPTEASYDPCAQSGEE